MCRTMSLHAPKDNCVWLKKDQLEKYASQQTAGYRNAYRHLLKCFAGSEHSFLLKQYREKLANSQSSIQNFFTETQRSTSSVNPRERAIHDYIKFIIETCSPLATVQKDSFRKLSKYSYVFSRNTVREVMLKTVELLEQKIGQEMKSTRGSIMYDGWSHCGVHYVGVYAMYMVRVPNSGSFVTKQSEELRIVLLSMSPMAAVSKEGLTYDLNDDLKKFDARTHVSHLREVFQYYGVDLTDWVICQVADNASVNRRIALDLGIPHIPCLRHKLASELNCMIENNRDLSCTINSVKKTMLDFRSKLTNRALLRNLASLAPVIDNKTRWAGKYFMLDRFLRLREEMIKVADNNESDVYINRSIMFRNKVKRYVDQLAEIHSVTLDLQNRGQSLADCRQAIDILLRSIAEGKNYETHRMYGCTLGNDYIGLTAYRGLDQNFIRGVVKIQDGAVSEFSDNERRACAMLKISHSSQHSGVVSSKSTISEHVVEPS